MHDKGGIVDGMNTPSIVTNGGGFLRAASQQAIPEATDALALIQGELQSITAERDAYIATSNAELKRQEDVHQAYLQAAQTRLASYETAIAALGRVLARLRARMEEETITEGEDPPEGA